MVALFLDDNKTNDDGDGRRTAKKLKVFIDKTTTLHVHHAILYISLSSLHPCDMKLSNFTRLLYVVGEHNTMQDLSSSWAKSSLVVQRRSLKDMGHI